jgi:purine-binding chemotaxis protein CheW
MIMADDSNTDTKTDMELATFFVGDALCGINILNIQEINKHFEITKVPQSSDYVVGILNLRGKIVTIVDLGKKLELSEIKQDKDRRNIIVNSKDEHIGLLVDSISDVVTSNETNIEPSPSNLNGIKGKYFSGVLKTEDKLIGILDIDEVLKE